MTNTSLIIADLFHLVGLIEERGRGNNRVIEMCRKAAGIRPSEFPACGAGTHGGEGRAETSGKANLTEYGH
jgi:hypothetical protein